MKKRLKIVLPLVALLAAGAAYLLTAGPSAAEKPHAKVDGEVYALPREFLIALAEGRLAKIHVGLVLAPGVKAAEEGHAATPPEGLGPLPQEAVVRDIVTDQLTGADVATLTSRRARRTLKRQLLKAIRSQTDVEVQRVLLTDVAIQ